MPKGEKHKASNKSIWSVILFTMLLKKSLTEESKTFSILNQIQYEQYLETQKYVMRPIKSYINNVSSISNKSSIIKRYINRYKKENSLAMKNVPLYLANPLNCYVLVKSVYKDLQYVEELLTQFTDYVRPKYLLYPTQKDYETTLMTVVLLVSVYELNVASLANGNLTGDFRTPLTSSDCYELALASYEHEEYDNSLLWMKQAGYKYRKDCGKDCFYNNLDIAQFIRRLYFNKDSLNRFKALDETSVIGEIISEVDDTKGYSKNKTEDHNNANRDNDINDDEVRQSKISSKWILARRKLCWREHVDRKRLKCQYRYGPHPFLRLARFKVELLHLNPDITMFHDVIDDEEFVALKRLTDQHIQRVGIGGYITYIKILRRVSYIADNSSRTSMKISQRALDISGLSATLADNFKMMHYGAAGYFSAHTDCLTYSHDVPCLPAKSTVVFYLTEADMGGATAFLYLNMSVFPVRKSALMFNSKLPSGALDHNTLHGSCPILHGSKWIITKWLTEAHEMGNVRKWYNQH